MEWTRGTRPRVGYSIYRSMEYWQGEYNPIFHSKAVWRDNVESPK